MDHNSSELEAVKKIQKKYQYFDINDTSLSSCKIIFITACGTYTLHSDKRESLEILEALLLLKGSAFIEQMKDEDIHNIFIAAVESSNLKIVDRLIELMQNSTIQDRIIHINQDQAFTKAIINFDLKMITRLVEVTNDPDQLDKMIHAQDDFAFHHAVQFNNLPAVNRLIMATFLPKQIEKMVNSNNGYAFFYAGTFGYLEIIQYLLSVVPASKPRVLSEIIDDEFLQKIQDSDKLVQKLAETRNQYGEQFVMKFFDCIKYAKSVKDLALVSKYFIRDNIDSLVLEVLVDYIGDQDVSLTRKEKVRILNVLSTPVQNLADDKNIQDKKVGFVEKVLTRRAIKSDNILMTQVY